MELSVVLTASILAFNRYASDVPKYTVSAPHFASNDESRTIDVQYSSSLDSQALPPPVGPLPDDWFPSGSKYTLVLVGAKGGAIG